MIQSVKIYQMTPETKMTTKIQTGNGWKTEIFSKEFSKQFEGYAIVKQFEVRPDFYEFIMSLPLDPKDRAKLEDELMNKIVTGFWKLKIHNQIIVCAFEGGEKHLKKELIHREIKTFQNIQNIQPITQFLESL